MHENKFRPTRDEIKQFRTERAQAPSPEQQLEAAQNLHEFYNTTIETAKNMLDGVDNTRSVEFLYISSLQQQLYSLAESFSRRFHATNNDTGLKTMSSIRREIADIFKLSERVIVALETKYPEAASIQNKEPLYGYSPSIEPNDILPSNNKKRMDRMYTTITGQWMQDDIVANEDNNYDVSCILNTLNFQDLFYNAIANDIDEKNIINIKGLEYIAFNIFSVASQLGEELRKVQKAEAERLDRERSTIAIHERKDDDKSPGNPEEPWNILGIRRSDTEGVDGSMNIKKAYRRLARIYHPDVAKGISKTEAEIKFNEIKRAYDQLLNK